MGSTFKNIVQDPNVDVFVNFYAPCTCVRVISACLVIFLGCPYSQRLNPVWEQLGERLKSQRDKIVIARMDGTQNEVPGNSSTILVVLNIS